MQARSQDFSRGGGGGAYINNRDQIINVVMIRYASSEDRAECPAYGVSEMETTFKRVWESVASAEGASLWGGSGACPPPPPIKC